MSLPVVQRLIPGIEDFANSYHVGNYVQMRGSKEKFFESMPIYPRLGMHLLFYGGAQIKLLHNQSVEIVLKNLSIRQGRNYDSPSSVKSIPSFIDTYAIQTDELLEPDISKYSTFNEFFHRKLKDGARPVQNEEDPKQVCSAVDCRLTLFESVSLAKQFWIKGNNFDIPTLLGVSPDSDTAAQFSEASIAVFRLAPADYHRFHSPLDLTLSSFTDIPGQYYTVNPQAVNESGFDVFTANKRSILYATHTPTGTPIAYVAIGAMLVGSVIWTKKEGDIVTRGEELGYFAYGGSTVVVLFPKGFIGFDEDLMENSKRPIETLMKVGYSLGKIKV
ncbi:phosphatidylserine decarboxylase-domain-containing protein [Irpex rosettiformis]|uniref:Phosphatidylserine decarboxylase-domain-containing protein n=1 Tax=Irpex rosettiformis TaxID=378272 RepID=A0ACB8U848_9APHY|nr:phosphatidylserine decarboxylase-domain-containing protein [Irpex rosettiformis]